jgi:adenylylsulfate kinase-like enzyme
MEQPVIMFVGVGGSGKSTTARHLNRRLRELGYDPWLVRFDQFRKHLAPAGVDAFSANPSIKQIIYDRAVEEFNRYLTTGGSLIVDAGLSSERIRLQIKSTIPNLRIVHIYCPLWLAVARDTKRSLRRTCSGPGFLDTKRGFS